MTTLTDYNPPRAVAESQTGYFYFRPHPVYVYGGIALIAVKVLNWPISVTPLWHSFAGGILAMAQ